MDCDLTKRFREAALRNQKSREAFAKFIEKQNSLGREGAEGEFEDLMAKEGSVSSGVSGGLQVEGKESVESTLRNENMEFNIKMMREIEMRNREKEESSQSSSELSSELSSAEEDVNQTELKESECCLLV
ncbi:MAG: hypothetical protein LBG48_01870 [Rickettsiales bacterium]|nr:hypothetical protein [Rickettsiales bacterium]